MRIAVGILTISDRAARGERADASGPLLRELVLGGMPGAAVTRAAVVPDEREAIREVVAAWCGEGLQLILTTGGTGFSPRDVTPEAIGTLIERGAPGIVHAILQSSLQKTPHAMLSRPVAGIRGHTLVITFPGSPAACRENFEAIAPALVHGLELLNEERDADSRH